MSPAPVTLDYGPQDVDSTAGFGNIGAGARAKELLRLHALQHEPDFAALFAQPHLKLPSESIDLEEVERVAKPPGDVEGASVRGDETRLQNAIVTYIYIVESGRSARGVIAYDKLPESRAEYDRRKGALLAGGALLERSEGEVGDTDPQRVAALETELESLREELHRAQDPPPDDEYDEAHANDIIGDIKQRDLSDPEEYVRLQQLVEYEKRHKGRETVENAGEKALAEEDERRKQAEAGGGG